MDKNAQPSDEPLPLDVSAAPPVERTETTTLLLCAAAMCSYAIIGNTFRILMAQLFYKIGFVPEMEYFGYNCVGSFLMGFAKSGSPSKFSVLHAAFVTGMCGSFTSLSVWLLTACLNTESASSAVAQIILGLTLPFMFYKFGADLFEAAEATGILDADFFAQKTRGMVEIGTVIVLSVITFVLSFVIYYATNAPRALFFAAVIAPLGAVPRFLICYYLNNIEILRKAPIGTLVCNIVAVKLAVSIQRYANDDWLIVGVVGICGALSTVSSWVHDTFQLMQRHRLAGYVYCIFTVGSCSFFAGMGRFF